MSTQDDVSRTLREQADGLEDARPLTFDDVRGRARRIRRNRAGGVAAGVALVAAVVLPLALLGGTGADRSDPPPAPEPTRAIDPNGGGLPTLQDGVIIHPDGPRIPLPAELRDHADGFAVLRGDRYLVTQSAGDGREALLIDAGGGLVDRFPIDSGVAVGSDTSVAWVAPDRTLQLLVPGSDEPRAVPVDGLDPSQATAITGDCADQCTIAVRTRAGGDLGSTAMVTSRGAVTMIDENAAVPAVVDASSDGAALAGLDEVAEDGIHLCGGVYDLRSDDFLWHQCEDNVFSFSPDDALVMTTFAEGLGPTGLKLRDTRSGAVVAELTGAGLITSYAWEDATHLLAVVVADDGSTSVQRIGTAGTETVLDGFHTDDPTLGVPVILPSQ